MSHDFIHYLKSVFETDLRDLFQAKIMPKTCTEQVMSFLSKTAASFRVSTHLLNQFTHFKPPFIHFSIFWTFILITNVI